MRSRLLFPVVCAVFGGVATAAALMAGGVVGRPADSPVMRSAAPLLSAGPVAPTTFGDVYRREAAGVVAVTARTVPVQASAFDVGTPRPDGLSAGSGFVLDDDGRIATAAHLVRAAAQVQVEIDGRRLPARVVGLDERSDLAVLRIDPDGLDLHPLRLGDSDAVQVGDPVMAIGAAAGMAPRLAVGLLSARQARLQGPGGAVMDGALQTDARLHEGDWGGPLLDESGRVIGVNTRMAIGDGTETVELAVPANTARDVLSILRASSLKVVG